MLSFATEFPIEPARNAEDFLRAIQAWIVGSPHTRLTQPDFEEIHVNSEARVRKGPETLETLRVSTPDEDAAGVRYIKRAGGLEWLSTIVFSRTSSGAWVGIRVSCESSHPAARLPPAKKPVVVRTLLQDLGGSADGALRVGDSPIRLGNTDIDLAARLIRGTSGCRLPIVYVSADFQGNPIVDSDGLARDLAGMAHVVVEPNRPFSIRLKIEVNSENVYGGTVGVYWPDGAGRRSYFIGREFESSDQLSRAIIEEVRTALTNRRALERCTWASVQEAASRQAIQALRASGSQEVEKYIQTFDKELAAKSDRLEDAETEIRRLRAELQIYEARIPAGSGSLLRAGNEQDLYPNEVFGIVRDALQDASTRVPSDSRRQHVLAAILAANPADEDIAASMRSRIKQLLRGSKGVDAKVRRGLEEMGFSITEQGKHYKLVFQGDDRYTFTLPKSGSDHRGGLNAASDISRLLL